MPKPHLLWHRAIVIRISHNNDLPQQQRPCQGTVASLPKFPESVVKPILPRNHGKMVVDVGINKDDEADAAAKSIPP